MSEQPEKKGFFSRLRDGMKKTRDQIEQAISSVFTGGELNDEFYDELEAALIGSDMGVSIADEVVERLRVRAKKERLKTTEDVRAALREELASQISDESFTIKSPCVILVVGVNGVGKTTSIGKLAHLYKRQGKNVLIAAADTFRAAAAEQLSVWADRAGVPIVKQTEGSDPAAVVFDAISSGKARDCDVILVDTAGRLHNKSHLMEELKKIRRIIEREHPTADKKTLLVLEATTGQNGLNQAAVFKGAAGLDGIILTKMDGTAKGGVALAVREALGAPVAFIGVGESLDDLQPFNAKEYVESIV